MRHIGMDEAIKEIVTLVYDRRICPIIGAGFSKGEKCKEGYVLDSADYIKRVERLLNNNKNREYKFNSFSEASCKVNISIKQDEKILREYLSLIRKNFTNAELSKSKGAFLNFIDWNEIITLNIDDAIERNSEYKAILPYHEIRHGQQRCVYKIHGDAQAYLKYKDESIVFDESEYIKSLVDNKNKSIRTVVENNYRENNLLFIGCSLDHEPDLSFIYSNVKDSGVSKKNYYLTASKLEEDKEEDLESLFGITDIILVDDYETFYKRIVEEVKNSSLPIEYKYKNPSIVYEPDNDLIYFSGGVLFSDNNVFHKSQYFIDRRFVNEVIEKMNQSNVIQIVGRRYCGKTVIAMLLCEKLKNRTVYFFPSAESVDADVLENLFEHVENTVFIFDTNSMSSDSYYIVRNRMEGLHSKNNTIIMFVNQTDNQIIDDSTSAYLRIPNSFSKNEIFRLKKNTDRIGLISRGKKDTNIDYLERIQNEQKRDIPFSIKVPEAYFDNEMVLLIMLSLFDKVYSSQIVSLGLTENEVCEFVKKMHGIVEYVQTEKTERRGFHSLFKIVHNSSLIIQRIINSYTEDNIVNCICRIAECFKYGDYNSRRICKVAVMYDSLNALVDGNKYKKNDVIIKVYKKLEPILSDDSNFWLQRSKCSYHISKNAPSLKDAYTYAYKAYMEGNRITTIRAALTLSLIAGMLVDLEKQESKKNEYVCEAIDYGYEAIFSEIFERKNELNAILKEKYGRKNYEDLIKEKCNYYICSAETDERRKEKALDILYKLSQ